MGCDGPQGKRLLKATGKSPFGLDAKNYSSYTRLIRVTAWIQRFVSKIKREGKFSGKCLEYEEIKESESKWI